MEGTSIRGNNNNNNQIEGVFNLACRACYECVLKSFDIVISRDFARNFLRAKYFCAKFILREIFLRGNIFAREYEGKDCNNDSDTDMPGLIPVNDSSKDEYHLIY